MVFDFGFLPGSPLGHKEQAMLHEEFVSINIDTGWLLYTDFLLIQACRKISLQIGTLPLVLPHILKPSEAAQNCI